MEAPSSGDLLVKQTNQTIGYFISEQWIQTAGHCVYEGLNADGTLMDPDPNVGIFSGSKFDSWYPYQDWMVVLGEFDDTKDDGWEQTFDVGLVFF